MRREGAHAAWFAALAMALLVAAWGAVWARAGPLPGLLDDPGGKIVALHGPWQFHRGDNPAWAAPEFDDSAWTPLTADRPWGQQGFAGYHGFAWYRRSIALQPKDGMAARFSLLVPEVGQAYEVYWNGSLAGRCGSLPPQPVWFVEQRPQVFSLDAASSGVLAVRVWNAPPLSDEDPGLNGGFRSPPMLGTPEVIAAAWDALNYRWWRSHVFVFLEALLYGLVGALSLLVWTRNREQWVLFWMAGFTLGSVLIFVLVQSGTPLPYTIAMSLDQPVWAIRDVSIWFVLLWLLDLRSNRRLARLTRRLAAFTVGVGTVDGLLVALVAHPELERLIQTADALMTAVNILAQLFPLVLVGAVLRKRKHLTAASWLVAITAFLVEMAIVIRNASQQGRRFTHWTLRDVMDGPLLTVGGSAISIMNVLQALLFVCIVYAVYASFVEHRRREVQMEHELKHAQELQRVLVPDASMTLPGFSISSAYRPAQEVGGDFFQVIQLLPGEPLPALIVLGDVSGKGLRAAMAVSFLVGAIRALAHRGSRPAELLGELNGRISGHLQDACATSLVLRVERDGRCVIASAGHPGPYIDGCEMELPGALPLGIAPAAEYEDVPFELHPGQDCALYTDGLVEARNRAGQMFGFPRVASMFGRHPSAAQAADSSVYFGQTDDITVVILTCLEVEETAAPQKPSEEKTGTRCEAEAPMPVR